MSGSSKWSLSLRLPHQNPACTSPQPDMCYVPPLPHINLLYLITRVVSGEEYISLSSTICSFLHSPVTSSLLGPNILLSTIFFNTLNLRSSLNVSNQVSHPYKKKGTIIVLYFLIFIFLDSKMEGKSFCTKWQQAFPDFNLLLILPEFNFDSLGLFPNIWTASSFQRIYY